MPSEKLFVRDPREVPFLHDQVKKVLVLADQASRSIKVREDDDFGFMTIQFLYKQIQHTESLLYLVPRRDAGLIARTMIRWTIPTLVGLSRTRRTCEALALLCHHSRLATHARTPEGRDCSGPGGPRKE